MNELFTARVLDVENKHLPYRRLNWLASPDAFLMWTSFTHLSFNSNKGLLSLSFTLVKSIILHLSRPPFLRSNQAHEYPFNLAQKARTRA
jgi:hypothetical protein